MAVAGAAVIALLVILPPQSFFRRDSREPGETSPPRIVVLPFENLGSPDDEYFADGVTGELISRLAAVSGLQVISRTSAMYYKDKNLPLKQIGEELEVGYVLEGSITWDRAGTGHGRVRITPQLIRVADDSQLWSERYDRDIDNLFSVQSDIAKNVIARLEVAILASEENAMRARSTENLEAYRAYLAGRDIGTTERREELELAVDMYQRAIDLDPQYALAYAGLAEAHSLMIHYRWDLSRERLEAAARASETALSLAPDLSESHRARGFYFYWAQRDYENALQELSIAAAKSPGDAQVWAGMSYIFRRQGRFQKSIAEMGKALRLNPQHDNYSWNQGLTYLRLRDYAEAEKYLKRAISLSPDRVETYYWLAETYRLWDGTPDRARSVVRTMPRRSHPFTLYARVAESLYEREYESVLALLQDAASDVIEMPRYYAPNALIECECLRALDRPDDARIRCEEARSFLEKELERSPADPRIHSALGKSLALLGLSDEAVRHGEEAVAIWPVSKDALDGVFFERYLAEIFSITGETERAVERLDFLLSIPSLVSVADLRFSPRWDSLRDDPRFQALLEKYDQR
jgi:TolB-like protein/Flp pilus assembly protein TadD